MYSNLFAVPWARLARAPVTIASRRWWYSLPSARLRMANTVAFRMAHSVLANSPQVGQSVRQADGVAPDRIRVVTNFASDHAFTVLPSDVRTELRRDLGIPEGRIVVGCVGRLVPVKDHATLLRAFAVTLTSNPNLHLLIVGDGPCRASLAALADNLALGSAVTFAGQRLDTLNYYQLCDVSALASESEGFPNTLVEAMAARCPVVATNVGGNVDAVIDGGTGYLVPVGDVKAFADALDRLVRSPSLRSTMGAAGLDRAETNYRASAVIPSLEGMYHDLLARYSSRRVPAPSGAAASTR
jgi:glycosyltransferase involved in cell wall biosynthesis